MKGFKRLFSWILVFAMIFSLNIICENSVTVTRAATEFIITSPSNNETVGAGYIDIQWNSVPGTVKNYNVYIDGSLVGTTTSTTYEFYTTKVNYHTAWIEANLSDGQKTYTPTVKFGVTKKGLCVNDNMGRNLDPLAMNMGWYYTWGTNPFSYTTYSQIEFVPMVWGTGNEKSIPAIKSKNYKYVLSYNEPDMPLKDKNGNFVGGSEVDVNTAINHWYLFDGVGQHVGTPAPALSPSWKDGTWLRTFMSKIDTSTIDFIPLHCYYGGYGGAAGANTFLKEVVDATWEMYHKPIWITEFAVSEWAFNDANKRTSVNQFLKTAIDGLNSRDYVERYSWFSFDVSSGNGASGLWYSNGALTDLGNTYVTYGNPTTEYKTGNVVNPYKPQVSTPQGQEQNATVKKPGRAKIKSVKNLKKRKVKLTLKKVKNAVGYQIKISDNKKFRGYWYKKIKKTTYTFKRLDKNTRYYYKARAYVLNGKKKLYGSWSKAKSVKIKK